MSLPFPLSKLCLFYVYCSSSWMHGCMMKLLLWKKERKGGGWSIHESNPLLISFLFLSLSRSLHRLRVDWTLPYLCIVSMPNRWMMSSVLPWLDTRPALTSRATPTTVPAGSKGPGLWWVLYLSYYFAFRFLFTLALSLSPSLSPLSIHRWIEKRNTKNKQQQQQPKERV